MLLGLSGEKESGKDTAYKFIKEWGDDRGYTVKRISFADPLKISAARALGYEGDPIDFCNEFKASGVINYALPGGRIRTITGREYLQWYGTEAHREVFGTDFWVDITLPLTWTDYPNVITCVTDVRFENEAQRVKNLGGYVWRVVRPRENVTDTHVSESPLPDELVDSVVLNDKGLDEYRSAVRFSIEEWTKVTV